MHAELQWTVRRGAARQDVAHRHLIITKISMRFRPSEYRNNLYHAEHVNIYADCNSYGIKQICDFRRRISSSPACSPADISIALPPKTQVYNNGVGQSLRFTPNSIRGSRSKSPNFIVFGSEFTGDAKPLRMHVARGCPRATAAIAFC